MHGLSDCLTICLNPAAKLAKARFSLPDGLEIQFLKRYFFILKKPSKHYRKQRFIDYGHDIL
jgi:hypothetical protein